MKFKEWLEKKLAENMWGNKPAPPPTPSQPGTRKPSEGWSNQIKKMKKK